MDRYYTRVCNFYYGKTSTKLVDKKKSLPLNGDSKISFDELEIISRKSKKKIKINQIKNLPILIRNKVKKDIKIITNKQKNFANLNFNRNPNIMGILNLTPDSFSDGGKFNKKNIGYKKSIDLIKLGSSIVDIGGESTRPGARSISSKKEWNRIKNVLRKICKKNNVSLDTRKSVIMEMGIKLGVKLINDVSGLSFDKDTLNVLKKYKTPFVLQHSKGTPDIMQNNPKYKNVILDIYDFFEKKIRFLKKFGITHNKIILDPGIGFGKNLKHNLSIIKNITIFHSLGLPVMLGISRKRFIKDLSGLNDSKQRLGGTISSGIFAMMKGVQILRVHDVNEIQQSIKTFKELTKE
jgi:dihydropteroate synthase